LTALFIQLACVDSDLLSASDGNCARIPFNQILWICGLKLRESDTSSIGFVDLLLQGLDSASVQKLISEHSGSISHVCFHESFYPLPGSGHSVRAVIWLDCQMDGTLSLQCYFPPHGKVSATPAMMS
jgi:hypothetical protein